MDRHPMFPNPTIHEALCEIHFKLAKQAEWTETVFGEFYGLVRDDYPSLEPVSRVPFRLQVGPEGVAKEFQAPEQRIRYRHRSGRVLLQLSARMLTVNELPIYPGWDSMRDEILRAWVLLRSIIKSAIVTRIGLRYINFIPRDCSDDLPSTWLRSSDYLPGCLLSSLPGFLYRLQTQLDVENRLIVSVGEASVSSDGGASQIVLDIDRITELLEPPDDEALSREANRLHDSVWDVFRASMTPRLESLLEGTEP